MGPGMMMKATGPRHFSIIAFAVSQVLIDLEVLWNMIHNNHQLHTFFHTYLGALLIVIVTVPLSKAISTGARRLWNIFVGLAPRFDMKQPGQTTWKATLLGAAAGAFSHVLFDSFYHADIEPFQPWSARNPCKGLMDSATIEILFYLLFIAGLIWFIGSELLRKHSRHRDNTKEDTCDMGS
jgi:hypothetical protein